MGSILLSRGLFNGHHHTNHTCPVPDESGPEIVPVAGNLTFHHLITIISGAFMAFTCLTSFALMALHAMKYSMPSEQKQIIRITFTIPFFSIISFITVVADSKGVYLRPLLDLYEAIALSSFFLLLCAYVSPIGEERENILHENGNLGLYNRSWFFVFQQPPVMLVILIATEITEAVGVYCLTSNKAQFAHIWLQVFRIASAAFAIIAVLRVYGATKGITAQQKPLLKLICFKLIIFLQVIQTAVFSFLTSGGHFKANKHLTFLDLSVALPSFIMCAEMVIISVLFHFAYPVGPYLKGNRSRGSDGQRGHVEYRGGLLGLRAFFDAANISDLLIAILAAPARLVRGRGMTSERMSSEVETYGKVQKDPPGYQGYSA